MDAIALAPVASALPAGLPTGMLRDVLLVYGDLSSRSGAFGGVELALRLQSIGLHNTCSEEFGGYAPRSLEPVVWQPSGDQHARHYEGLPGGMSFTADYTAKRSWTIIINAC